MLQDVTDYCSIAKMAEQAEVIVPALAWTEPSTHSPHISIPPYHLVNSWETVAFLAPRATDVTERRIVQSGNKQALASPTLNETMDY